MGNIAINPSGNPNLLNSQWSLISKHKDHSTWKNQITGEQTQEYTIQTQNAKDYLRHKLVYNFRYISETLVASKCFNQLPGDNYCTTVYRAKLYLEKINSRLNDHRIIEEKYILPLYRQCFQGFQELFEKVGPFDISQGMICFNQRGQIKVWINSNLAATKPMKLQYGSSLKGESEMIVRIVEIISRKSGKYEYIGTYILNQNPQTLEKALLLIQSLQRLYPNNLPSQQDLAKQYMTRSFPNFRSNNSRLPRVLSKSYQGDSLCSPNSTIQQMNPIYLSNEYIGPSRDIINNNINMSIPVSSVKQINQTNITRGGQAVIGSGRDIHGNLIQLPASGFSGHQQKYVGTNPSTLASRNIVQNVVGGVQQHQQIHQRGGIATLGQRYQTRGEQKIIGSPVTNIVTGNVQQVQSNYNTSRLGGVTHQVLSKSPTPIARQSLILNTGPKNVSPIRGQAISSIRTNSLFDQKPIQVQGRLSGLDRASNNRSTVSYRTLQHSPAPILHSGGLVNNSTLHFQNASPHFGSITQFYKQETQVQNIQTVTGQQTNVQVVGDGDIEQLPDPILGVLRQESNALNQHIKSQVNIQQNVNVIEGATVGANGIQFQNTFVPVTTSINVGQSLGQQQVYQGVPQQIHHAQVIQTGIPQTHSSRLMNTINRINTNQGVSNIQTAHIQQPRQIIQAQPIHQIQTNVYANQYQPQQIHQTQREEVIITETNPIPVTIAETQQTTTAFDFSKVGDNSEYTSPEIRKLLMKSPVTANKTFEPVFVPDERSSAQSPIKRTQVDQFVNAGTQQSGVQRTTVTEEKFQNNPYFNKYGGLHIPYTPQSNIQTTPVQSNIQQKVGYPQPPQHLHSQQIPPHLQHQHPFAHHRQAQPQVHQPQVFNTQQQHVQHGLHHHHQQVHQPQFQQQQQFQQTNIHHPIDPRLQHFQQHPSGALQTVSLPGVPAGFGLPFVPPEMMQMMAMMGAVSPDGAVIIDMVDIAPPVIQVVVDEQGNEYVEVDVGGMLPMMMGMGMGMGIPMAPGIVGMPIGMGMGIPPMMMGVAPMVIVQDIDIDVEDISPEMMMEMMGGAAPTRVVRGPTGRLVEVEVPQEPLIPQSFPASNLYGNPYQQFPGQVPPHFQQQFHGHIPSHIPGHILSQIPQAYAGNIYQQQQQHAAHVAQANYVDQQQILRRQQFAKQQAEQQRQYADYQAKVQNLMNKRQQLIEQQHRRSQQQQQLELEGLRIQHHHHQPPEIRETIHTTLTVDQGYGNIVETHTTQQIVIERDGAGSYNIQEQKIEITPQHQYNQQRYLSNQQQQQFQSQFETRQYNHPTTPIQQIYQHETRAYEPYNNQERAQSSGSQRSKGSHTKLNQGVISQPLTFSANKQSGIRSNNNIAGTTGSYVQSEQVGEYQQGRTDYEYQGYSNYGGAQNVSSSQSYQYTSEYKQPEYNFISQREERIY